NNNTINSNDFSKNYSTSYILDSGCLRIRSSSHLLSTHLCMTNSVNNSLLFDDRKWYSTDIFVLNKIEFNCPLNWLNINADCYYISNEPETIQEAMDTCIIESIIEKRFSAFAMMPNNTNHTVVNLDDKKKTIIKHKNPFIDTLDGEIAQYMLPWEVRLGFFLLDTNAYKMESELSLSSNVEVNRSSINEFQIIISTNNNNSTVNDKSCLIMTRTKINEEERIFISTTNQNKNCSQPRHVLCRKRSIIDQRIQQICFRKPLTLDVPVLISNYLTHELYITSEAINFEENYRKYITTDCGKPCPGNPNEYCGDTNTIILLYRKNALYMTDFESIIRYYKPYPDFVYDSCVQFNNTKQSGMYQFNIVNRQDVHPRHCLQLCKKYEQRYALLNSNTCLCTNIPIKKVTNKLNFFNCDQQCYGNYFYKCGHKIDSAMYSVYLIRPVCPYSFLMTDNPQQCAHVKYLFKDSFSSAQSYCKSMDSVLAKINNILEIQDLLPDTLLNNSYIHRSLYRSSIIDDREYFWIDRTTNIINNNRASKSFFKHCMETSKSIDRNCIVLRREKILVDNVIKFQRCFSESDQCSSRSAIPVCVDKNLESHSNAIPSMEDNDSSIIKINIFTDYLCGNDTDYHLIRDYCYKILLHETTWHKGKTECERDNATLLLPGSDSIFYLIKQLISHRHSYALSTGIAHVDYFYANETFYTKQHKSIDESIQTQNFYYENYPTLCKFSLYDHIVKLVEVSFNETVKYIDKLEFPVGRCGHVNFVVEPGTGRGCSKESCNQSATVICQKLPMMITDNILAKRLVVVSNYICL
ncbi:unnamed protein product, partial [Rotaria sp. Silwood2]